MIEVIASYSVGRREIVFDSKQRAKSRVEVELFLDDGSRLLCKLALAQGERLSDMMNDERAYIPVQTSQGLVVILRKNTVLKAVQLDQNIDAVNETDPYELLGVPRNVSSEQLSQTYRSLCAENHPDKLQASGCSSHFVAMANSRMIRINDAYQRILASRRKPDDNVRSA